MPRFLVITLLFSGVFVKWILQKKPLAAPTFYLFILLVGFYFLNLISSSWSLNTADTFYESQKVFLVPCTIVLFLNWLQNNEEEILLVKTLIVIASLYWLYAFYEIVKLPDLNFETLYGINSFAEHKNLLASLLFLLMTFPLYGVVILEKFWKLFSGFVLLLVFILILFLQTRSVYLALLTSGLLLFFYNLKHLKINRNKVLICLSFICTLLILSLILNPALFERFNVFSYSSGNSGSERLKIWSKTISLMRESPILGVGAGNWQYNYAKSGIGDVQNISLNEISFQRPHNDLLWIVSELGIIGFCFIGLIIAFIFRKSYPAIRSGNSKVIILFSFLSGLLVESCFSFPKERITHIFLASILLALLIKNLNLRSHLSIITSRRILYVTVVILSFSGIICSLRLKGEYYTVLLLQDKIKSDSPALIINAHKAISAFYKTDPTSTPIATYMGWAYNRMNQTDSLLYVSKLAYELSPFDYEVLSNYGSALERTGDRGEARKILKEAVRINPSYEPAIVNLVVTEYNGKNYKEAFNYLTSIPHYQEKYTDFADKINTKLSTR